MQSDTPFKLGQFTVTPNENRISSSSDEVDAEQCKILQPKIMDVLVYLAARYPNLVSRNELIETVWLGNFPVGEKTLTNAIWSIRQTLEQESQPVIRTVRGSGYLLLQEPQYLQQEQSITGQSAPIFSKKHKIVTAAILLGMTLLFGLQPSLSLVDDAADQKPQISNVTTSPGRELYPAVSPDGQSMAYLWRKVGVQSDLYLKPLNQPNGKLRQLTFGDDNEYQPVWSHDAKHLYFPRKNWDNRRCAIIQLTLNTKVQREIARCPAGHEINLAMSHDGKTLAFTGNSDEDETAGIYFLDLTDNKATPQRFSCAQDCADKDKHRDIGFAFSPDGLSIAVSRRVESMVENLFIVDLATRQSKQLTFGEGDIKGFAWHPEGDKIIYGLAKSRTREGFVINVQSGQTTPLNLPGFSYPQFVPNTSEVLFHQWQNHSFITQLSLPNNPLTKKASQHSPTSPFPLLQSAFDYHSAHYSEKTKRLVFTSNQSGYNELWSADTQGGAVKKLTELKTNLTFPRWSHDGKTIVFLGPKEKQLGNNIYLLDIQSQNISLLSSDFDGHFRPTWSYDDQSILAVVKKGSDSRLYRIPINAGKPQQLLEQNVLFAVQDQQQRIWFTRSRNDGLWVFDPTKTAENVTQWLSAEQFKIRFNWTVTKQGIYFQEDFKGHHKINYYDFAEQRITPLIKLPSRTIERSAPMVYLPNEHKLLLTQSEYPQVDIKHVRHPLL